VTEQSHAVFLSYASQDAQAAQKICEAFRAAGIQVFFDQSELRGGDSWDRKIRHEIHDCALFIPIVSQHTQERLEGYFRHEWMLATERRHHMAEQKAFLVPVIIDSTSDRDAIVPDLFRAVQWTRLPGGETPSAFVERVQRLLSPEALPAQAVTPVSRTTATVQPSGRSVTSSWRANPRLWVAGAVLAVALAYFVNDKFSIAKHSLPPSPPAAPPTQMGASAPAAAAAFNPPPHSIAVLPFVNMSGDKEQEYFSDGLTEELLNSLACISELQVAARTSAFSFKGQNTDIGTIARKLNVGAVLEGSVRRSAHTVRITTQLINAVTGFHMWSQTYDRNLGDVLRLQAEISEAVAAALKVTLLQDEATKIEVGGTHNPAAFDAYLRGSKAYVARHQEKDLDTAIAAYNEAIRLDPNYALAFVGRSVALREMRNFAGLPGEDLKRAQADGQKAIVLAPQLGEGHAALAGALATSLAFKPAADEYERAVGLAPGNAQVLQDYSDFTISMGRFDAGIVAARRAVLLDPLNRDSHAALLNALTTARRLDEAKSALQDVLTLDPDYADPYIVWGFYYLIGDLQASRTWCEKRPAEWGAQMCLAIVYNKLGRHADAEAELAKLKASNPAADDWAQYAEIYAQWGYTSKALDCLEKALPSRPPEMQYLKITPLLDPLRKEPRFQAVMRELKFPE